MKSPSSIIVDFSSDTLLLNAIEVSKRPSIAELQRILGDTPRREREGSSDKAFYYWFWDDLGIAAGGASESQLSFFIVCIAFSDVPNPMNPRKRYAGGLSILGVQWRSGQNLKDFYSILASSRNPQLRLDNHLVFFSRRWGIIGEAVGHKIKINCVLKDTEYESFSVALHFDQQANSDRSTDLPTEAVFHPICFLMPWMWLQVITSKLSFSSSGLIASTGILNRQHSSIPLKQVELFQANVPLLGRVLGYGSICVSTGGKTLVLNYIRYPTKLQRAFDCLRTTGRTINQVT